MDLTALWIALAGGIAAGWFAMNFRRAMRRRDTILAILRAARTDLDATEIRNRAAAGGELMSMPTVYVHLDHLERQKRVVVRAVPGGPPRGGYDRRLYRMGVER